jgi:biotin transport system substrate-specific component
MEEIGFKQVSVRPLSAPLAGWNTGMAAVLATGLVAICAHIALPLGFTPVPVTMQTFAVLLLGLLFAPGPAFACLALYLMEGAFGLPVFSPHGPGGIVLLPRRPACFIAAGAARSWLHWLPRGSPAS